MSQNRRKQNSAMKGQQSENDFNSTVEKLNDELSKDRYPDSLTEVLQRSVDVMVGSLEDAKNEEHPTIQHRDEELVVEGLTRVLNTLLLDNLVQSLDIIQPYLLLCSNWNKLASNKLVHRLVQSISVLVGTHSDVLQLIEVCRRLIEEVEVQANFNPPSYDIKEEYLEMLSNKYEEGV